MKFKSYLLVILSLFCVKSYSQDDLLHDSSRYVEDFAKIFTSTDLISIHKAASKLDNERGIKICVVSVVSTNGKERAEFATDLARNWKVTGPNGGITVVIMPNAWQILVTTDLQQYVPDIKAMQYGTELLVPNFKNKHFGTGIRLLINELQKIPVKNPEPNPRPNNNKLLIIFGSLAVLSATFFGLKYFLASKKKVAQHINSQSELETKIDNTIISVLLKRGWRSINSKLDYYVEKLKKLKDSDLPLEEKAKAFNEQSVQIEVEFDKSALLKSVQAEVEKIPKFLLHMHVTETELRAQYDSLRTVAPELIKIISEYSLHNTREKCDTRLKKIHKDLIESLKNESTDKVNAILVALKNTKQMFEKAATQCQTSLDSVNAKKNRLLIFSDTYRRKINETLNSIESLDLSEDSVLAFKEKIPLMREMLNTIDHLENGEKKIIRCDELEAIYRNAVILLTKEIAQIQKNT